MPGRKYNIMIYKQSEFTKEKKQAYIEDYESKRNLVWRGIILAFVTFAIYFMLETLQRSVLPSFIPQYMMPSHFSTLSLFLLVAYIGYIGHIVRYYSYLTFAEIAMNKWYTLQKQGYDPLRMIIAKMLTRCMEVLVFYSIGFIATLCLSMFLKYPVVPSYFLSLYIAGLIDVFFITLITMTCSLFISEQKTARYIVIAAAIVLWILRLSTGYYDLIADHLWMSDIRNLLDFRATSYLVYFLLTIAVSLGIILVRARKIAQYTNFPFYEKDMDVDEHTSIVILDGDEFKAIKDHQYVKRMRRKATDKLVNAVFTVLVLLGILINCFVLFVSLSSPDRETNFFGVIPFVFHSDSMEDVIMYNDLAFFDVVDREEPIPEDAIVLYRLAAEPVVSQIEAVNGSSYTVDILNYPKEVEDGYHAKTISREQIYGVYSGRSRWLGAIILFANTVFGRLLLLLLPVFMIFYYKPVLAYLKKKGYIIE